MIPLPQGDTEVPGRRNGRMGMYCTYMRGSTSAVAYGHPAGPCGGRIALPANDSYRQPMRASRIWNDGRSRTSCNPGHCFYDPRKPDGTRPSQVAKV